MSRRALLIATSHYADPQIATLKAPAADAQGVRDVLADPGIGDFEVNECIDSPRGTWWDRIGEFFLGAARDDLLLLYISGHGVKDKDGRLYFAASDTRLDRLFTTGIPASFIQEAAHASRSRRVLMIFDTCFSGAFAKGFQNRADASSINAGEYFQDSTGMVVITASGALQYALEDDAVRSVGQPSLFSRHLIQGLKSGEADSDGDGRITSEDLFRYVLAEVRAETAAQRPQRWAFGLDGDLVIASNPRPRAAALPEDIVALMEHRLPELRLQAVLRLESLAASSAAPMALAARTALEQLAGDKNHVVASGAAAALAGNTSGSDNKQPPSASHAGAPAMVSSAPSDAFPGVSAGHTGKRKGEGAGRPRPTPETPAPALKEARPWSRRRQTAVAAGVAACAVGGAVLWPLLFGTETPATSGSSGSTSAVAPVLQRNTPVIPDATRHLVPLYRFGDDFQDCMQPVCPVMVQIHPGSFRMGSPEDEEGRNANEGPSHDVTLQYSFAVSKGPITRGQWRQYLSASGASGGDGCWGFDPKQQTLKYASSANWLNPGFDQDDTHPVVCVGWQDVQDYAAWMSRRTGHSYRLLSEAEYEYVARAGTTTPYAWGPAGLDQCAHVNGADASAHARFPELPTAACSDSFVFTSPVGKFPANAFGLHDTTGNVWTWTQDCYHGDYHGAPHDGSAWVTGDCTHHVFRGGAWLYGPADLRVARRLWYAGASADVGLRLARTR